MWVFPPCPISGGHPTVTEHQTGKRCEQSIQESWGLQHSLTLDELLQSHTLYYYAAIKNNKIIL